MCVLVDVLVVVLLLSALLGLFLCVSVFVAKPSAGDLGSKLLPSLLCMITPPFFDADMLHIFVCFFQQQEFHEVGMLMSSL